MEIPKIPQALVGSIVLSHRDIGRGGRIQRIEADSDRPFVLWEGNDIPIATEWQHIDAIDVKPYAAAIGMSARELQAEILALMKKMSNIGHPQN